MRLPFVLIPAFCAALTACGEFPELKEAVDSDARRAPYPDLVPLESITGNIPEKRITPETPEELDARVARLKARSARLNRSVIDSETHDRMQAGVDKAVSP